jgi:hypothetical protein
MCFDAVVNRGNETKVHAGLLQLSTKIKDDILTHSCISNVTINSIKYDLVTGVANSLLNALVPTSLPTKITFYPGGKTHSHLLNNRIQKKRMRELSDGNDNFEENLTSSSGGICMMLSISIHL